LDLRWEFFMLPLYSNSPFISADAFNLFPLLLCYLPLGLFIFDSCLLVFFPLIDSSLRFTMESHRRVWIVTAQWPFMTFPIRTKSVLSLPPFFQFFSTSFKNRTLTALLSLPFLPHYLLPIHLTTLIIPTLIANINRGRPILGSRRSMVRSHERLGMVRPCTSHNTRWSSSYHYGFCQYDSTSFDSW
jgi:hypothetical protein